MHIQHASEAIKVQDTENIRKDAVKIDDREKKKRKDKRGGGKKGQNSAEGERKRGYRGISVRDCTTPRLCSIKENAYSIILPL